MRLTPKDSLVGGRIRLNGTDLVGLDPVAMRRIRMRTIAMVFQDPMTSLNPVLTIGRQIAEPIMLHLKLSRSQARRRAIDFLSLVGIPAAARRMDDLPHQFSGGMRQRVMIAMALCCEPQVLIADEPTTALDVTIQAQILELIARLQRDLGMAVLLITHDLGVVAGIADRVNVMYAGRVIENGPTRNVFKAPRMPYTIGLLQSVPRLDEPRRRLTPIRGTPPDLIDLPPRCAFLPRCCYAEPICSDGTPPLRPVAPDQQAACRLDVQAPWMTR